MKSDACTSRIPRSPASCSARFRASRPSPPWWRIRCGYPRSDLAKGDPSTWQPEKIGAAILWAAVQFDRHISQGRIPEQAAQLVNQAAPGLPPAITQAMVKAVADDCGLVMTRKVMLRELEVGMTIDADVMSARGTRLVPRATEVTTAVLERLRAVAAGVGVVEPIRVSVKVLD